MQFLLEAGIDPESPCGKLGLSAREEAKSQKGKGKQRMEIYKLIELKVAATAAEADLNNSTTVRTPALGVSGMSPIKEVDNSVLDSSLDMSLDTSMQEPTPMAQAESQLLRGGENGGVKQAGGNKETGFLQGRRPSMRPPVMPGAAKHHVGAAKATENKENAVNQQTESTMFDTPTEQAASIRKRGVQRRGLQTV